VSFTKYMHIERFGRDEVAGIEQGDCLVFPKLDGANGSVWFADGWTHCGSRNRQLTLEGVDDNHGFRAHVMSAQPTFGALWRHRPTWHLHGEWLVPHTLRTYRPEAWRRFWIFDVYDRAEDRWVPWNEYSSVLTESGLDVVPPLAKITNPSEADVLRWVNANTYLIQDGAGLGEGVVVKRYDFKNRFGRTVWAKLVRNEFKEENRAAFGVPEQGGSYQAELEIVERHVTPELVTKERSKLEALGLPRQALIPRLLGTVYHCLVTEELWEALKQLKDPTVDFKKLRRFATQRTKTLAADLF
jgi:hypothetical protein